ncbi:hypothetical protein CFOL_v3_34204, partial [Cephalotus follicularis]
MGSHMNFKNFGDAAEGSGAKPMSTFSLSRQSSIYSLTFDAFQNTLGGVGKDFGSMNMDELLKNIWTAEETQAQAMAMTASIGVGEGSVLDGNLQRQGSLTLPRTLSQKTVDEVWRDLFKDISGSKDGSVGGDGGGSNKPQKQQTLGEMTLEEFLARAGVVREDMQQIRRPDNIDMKQIRRPDNIGFYGDFSRQSDNNNNLVLGFQQPNSNNGLLDNNNAVSQPAPTLALNVDTPTNNNLVQAGGLQNGRMGMVGLGTGGVTVAAGSPVSQVSPDVIPKNSVDTPSFSPVPYVFGRGRRSGAALEKVVERRQRRMIKNRESAARSRARKQVST